MSYTKTRLTGVVLVALAAGLIGFALLSHTWGKSGPDNRYSGAESLRAGLRSAHVCEDEECETVGYTKLLDERAYSTYVKLGVMTFWLGLAAGVALVGALVLALANFPIGAALSPARVAIVLVALAGVFAGIFALQKPAFLDARGYGAILFGAGALLGLFGAITLSRWEKAYALEKAMTD